MSQTGLGMSVAAYKQDEARKNKANLEMRERIEALKRVEAWTAWMQGGADGRKCALPSCNESLGEDEGQGQLYQPSFHSPSPSPSSSSSTSTSSSPSSSLSCGICLQARYCSAAHKELDRKTSHHLICGEIKQASASSSSLSLPPPHPFTKLTFKRAVTQGRKKMN